MSTLKSTQPGPAFNASTGAYELDVFPSNATTPAPSINGDAEHDAYQPAADSTTFISQLAPTDRGKSAMSYLLAAFLIELVSWSVPLSFVCAALAL